MLVSPCHHIPFLGKTNIQTIPGVDESRVPNHTLKKWYNMKTNKTKGTKNQIIWRKLKLILENPKIMNHDLLIVVVLLDQYQEFKNCVRRRSHRETWESAEMRWQNSRIWQYELLVSNVVSTGFQTVLAKWDRVQISPILLGQEQLIEISTTRIYFTKLAFPWRSGVGFRIPRNLLVWAPHYNHQRQ